MAGHIGDWPDKTTGAVADAIRKDRTVQKLNRAGVAKADDSPDSKGPAGTGKFGSFTPQNFTEFANAANPFGTAQTFDGGAARGNLGAPARPTGDLGNAIRQAAGVGPQRVPLPEMEGRLFKAFSDAEGRDPNVEDSEFWKAVVAVHEAYGAESSEAVISAANGELSEPMNKAAEDLAERFDKALNKTEAPTWLREIVRRNTDG